MGVPSVSVDAEASAVTGPEPTTGVTASFACGGASRTVIWVVSLLVRSVSMAVAFWKLTVPGPLSSVQLVVVVPGGLGRPSSLTVPSREAAAGRVTVRSAPALTLGAVLGGGGPVVYSTCRSGAPAGLLSQARAVRWPVPVTIIASALPLAQPGRMTISWTTAVRSGVRSFALASPITVQGTGDQLAEAVVRGRVETLPFALVKVAGLSAARPWIDRLVTSLCVSFDSNWTYARVIVAPFGIATAVQRIPTRWLLPSYTNSRSELFRYITAVADSSASSAEESTRASNVDTPGGGGGGGGGASRTVIWVVSELVRALSFAVRRSV